MPLHIPDSCANWIVTITNATGGLSAVSSIALGTQVAAPLTQTDVDRVANLFRDALAPNWDNSWTLGPVHVVENDGGTMKVWDNTGTEAGTHAASAYASPAVACIVSKQTGLAGRAHRGRMYFPGVEEAAVEESGVLSGSYVNAVQSYVDDLQADLIADAAILALALFHDTTTPGFEIADEIDSFRVRNVVGTMRPRQRR